MILSLAACSSGASSSTEAEPEEATEETAEATTEEPAEETAEATTDDGGEYNITLIMSSRDEFLSSLEAAASDAAKNLGVKLDVQDAQNDTSKQLQYIETAVNAGADAVIVNIVDATTGAECINAAGDVPVIFVNRAPSDLSVLEGKNACVVASDEMQSGGFQGEYLGKYFNEKGQKDIKYILFSGIIGQVATTNRTASAIQGLADAGLNAEATQDSIVCDWDRAEAMTQFAAFLESGAEYDCVICNNDAMAIGVIEAMKAAGIDPASKPIVGVDCTADGAQAVKAGEMLMTVFQNPVGQGSGSIEAAVNMIKGNAINEGTDYELSEESDQVMWIPFEPVTAENVDDYM